MINEYKWLMKWTNEHLTSLLPLLKILVALPHCVCQLAGTGAFFGSMVAYLAVALNKQAQKTMDYYQMFRMNTRGDVHSTRN